MLLGLAKVVANTTAALVLKAKNIAATCDDQAEQNRVIGAATQCALATSQLVACAKVRYLTFIKFLFWKINITYFECQGVLGTLRHITIKYFLRLITCVFNFKSTP